MYIDNWREELARQAKQDDWCNLCLQEVRKKEPAFLAIRSQLEPEQQELLDSYIAACEDLESAKTLLAYQLGKASSGIIYIPAEK